MGKTDKRLHARCQIPDGDMQDKWDRTFTFPNGEVIRGKAHKGFDLEEAQEAHRGVDPVDPSEPEEESPQGGQQS